MKNLLYISFFVILLQINADDFYNTDKKPKVDIVIESLCPFSIMFMRTKLKELVDKPGYDRLVELNYLIYGNCSKTVNSSGVVTSFQCQHGLNECFGNAIENCALARIKGQVEKDKFIACMFDNIQDNNKDFHDTLAYCIEKDSNEALYNEIIECAKGKEGNLLLTKISDLYPDHDGVPWSATNGVHTVSSDNKFLSNPLKFLCKFEYNKNDELCRGY